MSKGGFMTPKAIANRIKSKGLQKLRWYCQMCEKQCRDENGFKCHCLSEAHTRQMALFRDDPTKFMDAYSKEFEQFFMDVMRRKGGLRVKANTVYQEVVADRQHIHMNSTKWETLGSFVQYLGKSGLCRVEPSETGWWVQYIDRSPAFLARQEELARKAERSLDEEERSSERLRRQIEDAQRAEQEAREGGGAAPEEEAEAAPAELKERGEDEKIAFSFGGGGSSNSAASSSAAAAASASAGPAVAPASSSSSAASALAPTRAPLTMTLAKPSLARAFAAADDELGGGGAAAAGQKRKAPGSSHASSTLDALMAENERQKTQEGAAKKLRAEAPPAPAVAAAAAASSSSSSSRSSRLDHWLMPQIVVKILNKKLLAGALYKAKAVVVKVHEGGYVAELRLLTDAGKEAPAGTILRVDQAELETVLPALGGLVRVVNGVYRGEVAVLLELDEARYCAKLRIESGPLRGKEVDRVEYEDISKCA